MSERAFVVELSANALSARLRRMLRRAGYKLTVKVTLTRDDGQPMGEFDTRGIPSLVEAWTANERDRRAGVNGESAAEGIERLVAAQPANRGRANT